MASYEQQGGKPLPKFGEWDVNDPASAEGFTVIFNKARDEKKTGGGGSRRVTSQRRSNSCKDDDKCSKSTRVRDKEKEKRIVAACSN
ncbi:RIN4, pathogenic type III effector avirulence factor Avr cleavage site [Sesbania bispinosa]|nr:RIN4, pathogenic type III effector avirulence factor Avr cleavage site [Sesbania bispinosa]